MKPKRRRALAPISKAALNSPGTASSHKVDSSAAAGAAPPHRYQQQLTAASKAAEPESCTGKKARVGEGACSSSSSHPPPSCEQPSGVRPSRRLSGGAAAQRVQVQQLQQQQAQQQQQAPSKAPPRGRGGGNTSSAAPSGRRHQRTGGSGPSGDSPGSNSSRSSGSSSPSEGGPPDELDLSGSADDLEQQWAQDLQAAFEEHPELSQCVYTHPAQRDQYDAHFQTSYGAQYQCWLRAQELKYRPLEYMTTLQRHLRPTFRTALIDWMAEVCSEYRLQAGTLFLVVELLDRSLSTFHVSRDKLQLLGCACLLLACKFEEEHVPAVGHLVYMSDSAYTAEEVVDMECTVLQRLSYRVACPTPNHFAPLFAAAAGCDARQAFLCLYLLELAMLDYPLTSYTPSHRAAAAALLTRMIASRGHGSRSTATAVWTAIAQRVTGYGVGALEACVRRMRKLHEDAETAKLKCVRQRYCKAERHGAALLTSLPESELCFG